MPDRGYIDFARLHRLGEQRVTFVVRAKKNLKCRRLYSRAVDRTTGLVCDQTVRLTVPKSAEAYPGELWRVRARDPETSKNVVVLTNDFTLPAFTVAELYHARGQIVLFFKWIKQHLRIKRFFGTSANAVQIQLWIAISVYVVVAIVRKRLEIECDLYTLLQILSVHLFEKAPLAQVLAGPDYTLDDTHVRNQLRLFAFYPDTTDVLYLRRYGRQILRRKSLVSESYDELHSRFALSGYKPIESSAEDRLDRVRFAEALATQIATAPVTGSFVIGLTGPWGSGKTSLLNMVSETLTENQPDTVVLKFNPWLFSGTEQLVARFFEEMGTQLLEKPDEKLKRLGSALEVYGQLLSPLKFVPVAGSSFDIAAAAMKATGSFLQSRADEGPISVETQRRNLESALRDLSKRVVVVIDDIDRLHPAEIRDIVRLVRLTADFPGTIYVLAFDRPCVEQALSEVENDGSAYLEKILQVAYDVPPIQEAKLTELLISGLNSITASVSHGPYDEANLQEVFYLAVRPLFKTVRDVRRYLNALPLAFAVVGDEVSLTDVLALEAMRTAAPAAFSKLSSASEALTGAPQAYLGFQRHQQYVDERKAELEDLIESAGKHSNVVREMCASIFPASQSYLGNTHYGQEWLKTWRRDRRVAHPEVLRFYLEKGLPEGVMSAKNVDAIFDALGNHDKLASLLSSMDTETLEHTLERLEDYEDDYPVEDVEVAVRILMNQTERLREGRRAMFDPGADMKLQRVVLRLLRRVADENERASMLKKMLPHLGSISAQMMLVQVAGHREHVGHSLVSEQDVAWLEEHLCSAFQHASVESLAQERDLLRIMGWTEKIGGEPMQHRAREVVEDDNVFLRMLRSSLSESHSQRLGSTAVSTELTMPWDLMVSLLGESLLLRRIQETADSVERKALDERTASALTVAERYASGWRPSSYGEIP